jgi:hypothetical protein
MREREAERCRIENILLFRYASLYFIACIDPQDNELIVLEIIHQYVEILDRYFGSVCELDLIFNFHKVNMTLFSDYFLFGLLQCACVCLCELKVWIEGIFCVRRAFDGW